MAQIMMNQLSPMQMNQPLPIINQSPPTMTMMSFLPIYDYLLAKVLSRTEKGIDPACIHRTINNFADQLSPQQDFHLCRLIQAIICYHEYKNSKTAQYIPNFYGGKLMYGKRGILYDLTSLPILLQQIIGQLLEELANK